eukprot:gnl/Hemi2/3072_TR1083_c0_g10_i1.p1 gnl/Hemi2/3072_TR1083_c0_g10~~gnl/Hemi2/3072_TR1083_c0_g10_i1.p1  ORF type:complete len:149 (-),score=39.90 gnl/Hemi2/3072_TR1083_c0_g10_i1:51-497(-)
MIARLLLRRGLAACRQSAASATGGAACCWGRSIARMQELKKQHDEAAGLAVLQEDLTDLIKSNNEESQEMANALDNDPVFKAFTEEWTGELQKIREKYVEKPGKPDAQEAEECTNELADKMEQIQRKFFKISQEQKDRGVYPTWPWPP